MEKVDLAKQHKQYYTAKPHPELVDIAPAHFLSITGQGDPSGSEFATNIQALYTTAYTIKFNSKADGCDFKVPKLEGLWWYDETQFPNIALADSPGKVPRSAWKYRLLLRMPDFVGKREIARGIQAAFVKQPSLPTENLEYFAMAEGTSVQMLHMGPFATELSTLIQIQEFMQTTRLVRNGLHHEIYLSDFRRTAPEKLRTILREPVV